MTSFSSFKHKQGLSQIPEENSRYSSSNTGKVCSHAVVSLSKMIALGILFSKCTQQAAPAAGGNRSLFDSETKFSGGKVQPISKPAMDPKNLMITDFSMHKLEREGGSVNLADFRYSGGADYIELQACPLKSNSGGSGVCEAVIKVTRSRYVLRNYFPGAVSLKARACLDPGRSTAPSVQCGAWSQTEFQQGPVFNETLIELQYEEERLVKSKAELDSRFLETLKKFASDTAKCQERGEAKERLLGMTNLVSQFLEMGQSAMYDMLSNWDTEAVQEPENNNRDETTPDPDSGIGTSTALKLVNSSNKRGLENLTDPIFSGSSPSDPIITAATKEEQQRSGEAFTQFGDLIENSGSNADEKETGDFISKQGLKMAGLGFASALPTIGVAMISLFSANTQAQPDTCLAEVTARNEISQLKNLLMGYERRLKAVRIEIKKIKAIK